MYELCSRAVTIFKITERSPNIRTLEVQLLKLFTPLQLSLGYAATFFVYYG